MADAAAGWKHNGDFAVGGSAIGVVDHVEDAAIKLTKNDAPDGQHHFIPFGWVERVDGHVHLTKNSMETERDWKPTAASCVCSR